MKEHIGNILSIEIKKKSTIICLIYFFFIKKIKYINLVGILS